MLQPGNNIPDLLLGITDAGQVMPAVSQADASAEGTLLFGDILAALTSPGDLSAALPTVNNLLPTSAPVPSEMDTATCVPERQLLLDYRIIRPVEKIGNPLPQLEATTADDIPMDITREDRAAGGSGSAARIGINLVETAPAEDQVVEFNRDLALLMPLRPQALNPSIRNLMEFVPTRVKEGRYVINDITVKGDTLQLTVTGNDATATPVRLVIPAEILDKADNLPSAGRITAGRIDPNTGQANTEKVDDLLLRLNLKEIEIKFTGDAEKTTGVKTAANVDTASGQVRTAHVQIVAEVAGAPLLIKSRVQKDQLYAFKTAPKVNPKAVHQMSADGEGTPSKSSESEATGTRVRSGLPENSRVFDGSGRAAESSDELPDLLDSETGSRIKERIVETTALEIHTDKNGVPVDKTVRSSVRLVLPNDIKSALKPDGKSITIRIEPEHLGPAKLNLSLQSDGLRARLMVESAQVKTTVEAGLDKLVDQLHRADIKVDIIEVTVDGNPARSDFFHRRPTWNRQPSRLGIDPVTEEAAIQLSRQTPGIMQATAYQGAGSINILA